MGAGGFRLVVNYLSGLFVGAVVGAALTAYLFASGKLSVTGEED
ncbi:hypothetical protein PBI_TOURACH_92 [Mycobacterium phage Tourach]|uniref:Uncharacterized protein n=1 Tax=Mycobacterium phage Tourach TaxID=2599882 RepID=A0A5J6TVE0_9CAUD|nr:hypothetical protein J4T98_gp092 [Mycobacterium phage Tourach]QFG14328.1 hypothetical protein PBI_TOURACH_92 [Mycobacterium phage Tourach]